MPENAELFAPLTAPLTAIGLMSGTSLDGIDAAILETDGQHTVRAGGSLTVPHDDALRRDIRALLGSTDQAAARDVEARLTENHARAVASLLGQTGLRAGDVDVIGFHGHTITHFPPPAPGQPGWTWQIGDGAALAARTGIDVVNDLRGGDMAAGGHGAPVVPVYQAALAADVEKPLAVLNVGGVANITFIGEALDSLVAFDTGPGNALIDDWVARHTGAAHDEGGALASSGKPEPAVLATLLDNPYFAAPAPKSLDRLDFTLDAVAGLSLEDGAATLTRFTAEAAGRARDHLPAPPRALYVTGGGRHNAAIMRDLTDVFGLPAAPVEDLGWNGDMLEAQAFAYLAVRSLRGLPLTFPGTTGCSTPVTGGRLWAAT